jgi:hypothetical protein
MSELDRFPSLLTFGQRLDGLAERDARRRTRGSVTRFAVAVGVVLAVAGGTYAVPVTRAGVDDVYSAFSGWFSGDEGAAPGHPVGAGDDVPAWVAAADGEKRVLAQADGQTLTAIRQGDKLTLALAGFAESDTIDGWGRQLSGQRLQIVGPGEFVADGRHDLRPLFGLVSASVRRVAFNYADGGPPVVADGLAGAFAITIQTNRHPISLTAYDDTGHRVARIDFIADPHDLVPGRAGQTLGDFRYCPATGCSPWAK